MKYSIKIGAFLIFSILAFACQNSEQNTNVVNNDSTKITTDDNSDNTQNEDFDQFYSKFISDSDFQMDRINFPIKGKNIIDYGEEEEWTADNWYLITVHVDDVDRNELTVEIEKDAEKVSHLIYLPNSGFSVSYTFEIIDGKWFLTERTDSNL